MHQFQHGSYFEGLCGNLWLAVWFYEDLLCIQQFLKIYLLNCSRGFHDVLVTLLMGGLPLQ
jgi:hypothetical protein